MVASEEHRYKMTVAGQLFKHLGLQMYSGAVPAISELISNAYDAMARNIWITIPTGRPISQNDEILVKDDGHGMSYEECNSLYLFVGRDRRGQQNGWTKEYNELPSRKVQGRKGIGKLAGFGIANLIAVRSYCQILCMAVVNQAAFLPVSLSSIPSMNFMSASTQAS